MRRLLVIAILTISFMLLGCKSYLNGPLDKSCQGVQNLQDCTP